VAAAAKFSGVRGVCVLLNCRWQDGQRL